MRMRVTVNPTGDRVGEMRMASDLRRDLYAHAPVGVDPDYPLRGVHRDEAGRVYLEFATDSPTRVQQVLEQYDYGDKVTLAESTSSLGDECVNCGNVSGPILLTVCPNCQFRDITPCPICGQEISRPNYVRISADLFRCPNCDNQVRLRFNSPMVLLDGSYNPPLVVVQEVRAAHAVR